MNFLQLARRVYSEAGLPGTGPTTVLNQTGELGRVVAWTADAWLTVQRKQLWDWQWEAATITVPAGTSVVSGTIPAERYLQDQTYIGDSPLTYRPWREFSVNHPTIDEGTPTEWSIRPDGAFVVNAAPAADTAIAVQRHVLPTEFAADADIPALPVQFHMAIVWRALMDASDYDEAGVTRATATAKYAEVLHDAVREQIPSMTLGEPLL